MFTSISKQASVLPLTIHTAEASIALETLGIAGKIPIHDGYHA